eukprot:scaffold81387_cov19-Tisochrysis_lutea.AAC.1
MMTGAVVLLSRSVCSGCICVPCKGVKDPSRLQLCCLLHPRHKKHCLHAELQSAGDKAGPAGAHELSVRQTHRLVLLAAQTYVSERSRMKRNNQRRWRPKLHEGEVRKFGDITLGFLNLDARSFDLSFLDVATQILLPAYPLMWPSRTQAAPNTLLLFTVPVQSRQVASVLNDSVPPLNQLMDSGALGSQGEEVRLLASLGLVLVSGWADGVSWKLQARHCLQEQSVSCFSGAAVLQLLSRVEASGSLLSIAYANAYDSSFLGCICNTCAQSH